MQSAELTSPAQPSPFYVDFDEQGERLVIPMRKSWKVIAGAATGLIALPVKFAMGYQKMDGWFFDTIVAALTVVAIIYLVNAITMLFGREEIQISHGELVHTWRVLFAKREARFSVAQITNLRVETDTDGKTAKGLISAFRDFGTHGAVVFLHGTRMVKVGAVLDVVQGQRVVDWLVRRLPRSATNT